MTKATEKIDALLRRLEESGAEPERLDALRRTQSFKRSWVDLAETLVQIRKTKAYERWGHADFHEYCAAELHLKRATVDKLTISFSSLQRLAPQVLAWDGIERQVPSYQAVDYFSRAAERIGERAAANDAGKAPGREELKELRHAVFDEGQSVAELRRRFDPVFNPKPKGAETLALYDRTDAAARKLVESLADLPGVSERRVAAVEKALAGLREELQSLAEPLREKVREKMDRAKKRAREAAKA